MQREELLHSLRDQGCSILPSQREGRTTVHSGDFLLGSVSATHLYLSADAVGRDGTVRDIPLADISYIRVTDRANGSRVRVVLDDGTILIAGRLTPARAVPAVPDIKGRPEADELIDLAALIVPDADLYMWTDVIRGNYMLDTALLGMDRGIVEASREWYNSLYVHVLRRCAEIGLRRPTRDTVTTFLDHLFFHNPRNPFIERISSVQWDGTPRVDRWFIDVFGGTAPGIYAHKGARAETRYLTEVSRRWVLGAMARNHPCSDDPIHEVVPIFVGPQGCGKTSGLRYTGLGERTGLPDESSFYVSTTRSAEDMQRMVESLYGAVIGELAECTQFRSSANEDLKAQISMGSDTYRRPYERAPTTRVRRFILAGTSNESSLFTDNTGSRRFYPIVCDPSRIACRADLMIRVGDWYEAEQMWAEALLMYDRGERQYVDDDVKELAGIMQTEATSVPLDCEIIDDILDRGPETSREGCKFTKAELIDIIQGYQVPGIPADNVKKALRTWKRFTPNWEERVTTRGDSVSRRYMVRTRGAKG